MDVTAKLAFSLLVVALAAFLCLTEGRPILWMLEITTFRGNSWKTDLFKWIFFRDDDTLRKTVLITFYGIMLGLVWLT